MQINTRLVLTASAWFMGALGAAATFAPQEILAYAGSPSSGRLPLVVQLLGALYLSFAMINWTARGSLIGGIYNRPVAMGNFLHFVMGALTLGKGAFVATFVLPLAAAYAMFAIAFALVFFTSPVQRSEPPA